MKILLFIIITVFIIQVGNAQTNFFEYFGQTPPGNTPEVFAPGIISLDNREESFITFSPDGKECYFTVHDVSWNSPWIMETIYRDDVWTTPENASFTDNTCICPSISPDGTKLFFIKSGHPQQCLRIAEGGWSAPVEMDGKISSGSGEYSCHLSDEGNFYVCSWRSGGKGGCDGWRIPYVDGEYQQAKNLGFLNSSDGDCDWAPGPNESYLIFQSRRPPVGLGGGFSGTDLFITFALPNGGWTYPRNLGQNINSAATDLGAWISHDGKYLFFSSNRRGTSDIYWVSTNFIDSLRHTNFIPYLKSQIANQRDTVGHLFNFQIPDSTFIDDDGNSTLTYSAKLSSGLSLPSWLLFDSTTRTFSGTPTAVGNPTIKVTAADTANASVSCTFKITIVAGPTGIEEDKNQLPKESQLLQNYPNPFNPTTMISYQLSASSNAKLTIYNMLGQKIKTLVNRLQNAGEYSLVWDSTDDHNNLVNSGVYFYKLETNDHTFRKKMILLK